MSDSNRDISGLNAPVRLSIRLSPQAKAAVERIMALGGIPTIQEAILRAISDELFFLEQRQEGWKAILEKDNQYRQVLWP